MPEQLQWTSEKIQKKGTIAQEFAKKSIQLATAQLRETAQE